MVNEIGPSNIIFSIKANILLAPYKNLVTTKSSLSTKFLFTPALTG